VYAYEKKLGQGQNKRRQYAVPGVTLTLSEHFKIQSYV